MNQIREENETPVLPIAITLRLQWMASQKKVPMDEFSAALMRVLSEGLTPEELAEAFLRIFQVRNELPSGKMQVEEAINILQDFFSVFGVKPQEQEYFFESLRGTNEVSFDTDVSRSGIKMDLYEGNGREVSTGTYWLSFRTVGDRIVPCLLLSRAGI